MWDESLALEVLGKEKYLELRWVLNDATQFSKERRPHDRISLGIPQAVCPPISSQVMVIRSLQTCQTVGDGHVTSQECVQHCVIIRRMI
jgi:hypothetical protein